MKCLCEGIDLSDAVLKVVKACSSKTTLPVLECIKIAAKNDTVTLSATDGEIAIIKTIKAEVDEEGQVCVPGKYFADFIKKLEGVQITLCSVGTKMDIVYADSQTSMQTVPTDDFPYLDTQIRENSFKIKTADLKRYVAATSFCCASDDSRPILKGCQVVINGDEISVTALDGFRLATISGKVISATGNIEIICPARTLNEIVKMLPDSDGETEIFIQRGMILVENDNTILTSRLYGGDYMKKNDIIPRNFSSRLTVNRELLKASIDRAAILVRGDKNNLINFDITGEKVEIISASEIGSVQEPVKASLDGKDIKIAMNSKFITEALNALDEEEIVISFNSQIQPFICQNAQNKDALYLILPVRLGNNG